MSANDPKEMFADCLKPDPDPRIPNQVFAELLLHLTCSDNKLQAALIKSVPQTVSRMCPAAGHEKVDCWVARFAFIEARQ